MDVRQYFVMAVKNLQANKLRFAQTMLGLVIGVAAVTAILIVQQGMVNSINAMYQEYSPSLMFMADVLFFESHLQPYALLHGSK